MISLDVSQLLLSLASALTGALLGGAVSWRNTSRERRMRQTLALYSEFHAPEFNQIRILALEALEAASSMPAAYEAASGHTKTSIASVAHFWEKAALLLKAREVEPRLLARFLGQYARWWRPALCKGGLDHPEWGATLRDVDELFRQLMRDGREGARR